MKKIQLFVLVFLFTTSYCQDFPKRKYYDTVFLLQALNSYHSEFIKVIDPGIKPGINLTSNVKRKLISLLKREWTEQEIKPQVDKYFRKRFEQQNLGNIIKKTNLIKNIEKLVYDSVYKVAYKRRFEELQGDSSGRSIAEPVADYAASKLADTISAKYYVLYDSVYRAIYDSTALAFRKEKEREIIEQPVPDEIVLSAAMARLKEAIPILKKDLYSTDKHYFQQEAAELALAGLGDTSYLRKIFKNHEVYVAKKVWEGEEMLKDFSALSNYNRLTTKFCDVKRLV